MICYYERTETAFEHNGLGALDNYIVSPVVTEELNGLFRLEFDYPITAKHASELVVERVVRCPVPDMADQLFRISERCANIDGLMHIVAYHVFYDLARNFIEDTNVVNKNGSQAISQILGATQYPHPFTGSSDIMTVATARLVRLSPTEVLLDDSLANGFRRRWGVGSLGDCEILRDNFHITMNRYRDSDNGVQIRDKKNLTGYSSDLDFSTVVTRIMPQGFDGLFLPEKYVDSARIGDYLYPRIAVIRYDSVKAAVGEYADDDDAIPLSDAYNKLRELAQAEYANGIDLPSAAYHVEFAPLEKTEEYKAFAALETIDLGDVVTVVHEDDKLNISARVVSYRYDPLAKCYIDITLGSQPARFTDVAKVIERVDTEARQAADDANYALHSANGKNTNYYGADTPSNPREGDLWYKDNGDKLELWVYETRNGVTQWFPLLTDLTQEEIKQELEAAVTEAEQAKAAADNALEAGQAAQQAAEQAKNESEEAIAQADTAFTKAQEALDAAEGFSYSIDKQTKVINDLAGVNLIQSGWQQGSINTNTGADKPSTYYVRSRYINVKANAKYLLQTYEGASINSVYSPVFIFYYLDEKTYLSYMYILNEQQASIPFTVPENANYLRLQVYTNMDPSTINCYLLATDTVGGYVNLTTLTNMAKVQVTTDALMLTVAETTAAIGTPYVVKSWERGSLNTNTGAEIDASNYLRSGFIDVKFGDQYTPQYPNGSQETMHFHWFDNALSLSYVNYVPAAKQHGETITTGAYNNTSVLTYLNSKNVESMDINGLVTSNPYTSTGDFLVIYRFPLEGRAVPNAIRWQGRKDVSDNIVALYTDGAWEQIGVVASSANSVYDWMLGDRQRSGITSDAVHIAFFSIKAGPYAGIYNDTTTPFTLNPDDLQYQVGHNFSSSVMTVPANATKLRVSVNSYLSPDEFKGNVYASATNQDYTRGDTLYSALLMQKDFINLRVSKNDVVNQINISAEGILISGNKIRITGQTTIDNGVIGTAMIADAAITNAKIANLDAAKITTGTLSADRIAAGSITSAKLTVANGYITNAMIADATIQSAKIAAIDAAKITTGTLSAARIGANSITADKLATNAIQVGLSNWTNSIRITPTDISWYNGSTLEGKLNSNGMSFYYGDRFIGGMGESVNASDASVRGISTHLNGQGDYCAWAYRTGTSGNYTQFFTLAPKETALEKGIHLGINLYTHGYNFCTAGANKVYLGDEELTGAGIYPGWMNQYGKSGVVFGAPHLYLISNGPYYNFTLVANRIKELISRVNEIIRRLNFGWVVTSSATTSSWSNSGLSAMSTELSNTGTAES